MFLLWLRQLPWCGDQTSASVLPPAEGRSSPTNTLVLPSSSFIPLSFAWFYVFFQMAIHSSTLAWKIPWTEEPDRLQSMGSQRVKTQLSNFTFTSLYRFFSTGQVLLSALSWCSECTSVSEGVFPRCLWREMYSISTYSSTILFSPKLNFYSLENSTFFFFVWKIARKNGTCVINISFILIETLHWKYDCCFNLS